MSYFGTLMFVLQIIGFSKAELKLDIHQHFNGTEVPISKILQANIGRNVTLTCKLISNDNVSHYIDEEISWGWNRENIQFQNLTDLQKLADNISKPLWQFLKKSDLNKATIAFNPLSYADSGKYFCMSLKYKLFKLLQIDVIVENETLIKKNILRLRSRRSNNENGTVLTPKFFCNSDMFVCNSRTSCLHYAYVCDSIKDCIDGSDEDEYICGSNPCQGKIKCSNGRCILPSVCCDYNQNNSCNNYNPRISCCSEIRRANRDNYISSSNIIRNTVGVKDDGWTNRRGYGGGENSWDEVNNNPVLKKPYVTRNNANYNPKLNSTTSGNRRSSRRSIKILWILLSPVVVIVTVIGTLAKMWTEKCRIVSSNSESLTSSVGNNNNNNINQQIYEYRTQGVTNESNNVHLDLPPSYDEATR